MSRTRLTIEIFMLLALIAALPACRRGTEDEAREIPSVSVVVRNPDVGTITSWHRTTCELSSPLESRLSFPQGGRIVELMADEGDRVNAGQILGTTDTSTLQAQYQAARSQVEALESQARAADVGVDVARTRVEQARAAFEQAEADYERFKRLLDDGVATQSEFEQMELRYETSRLNLEAAQDGVTAAQAQADAAHGGIQAARDQAAQVSELISDGTLRAPYDGYITARWYDPGTVVGPGTPVFKLIADSDSESDTLEVGFNLPETVVQNIYRGMEVYLHVESCDDDIVTTIQRINPEVDTESRMVGVICTISDVGESCLLPGMFGTIRIPLEIHEDALLIPEDAVLETAERSIVYIADGDTAYRREVTVGLREEGMVEITEGLSPTDEVVVVGSRFLKDGSPIQRMREARPTEGNGESETGGES